MSNPYSFTDGEWKYEFSFHRYNTIRIMLTAVDGSSDWAAWHVWYSKDGICNWSNPYGKELMSDSAKEFGNKLIKMRLFL